MHSIFVTIMVISSIIVLLIISKIGKNEAPGDVNNNWDGVWKERLKIDN
ncbi:MAG TPA: hypothetical protein PLH80_00895 [Spirochaetota bacterium]|nr:hypothetical protein [Spirochaetota bacterium]HOF13377.1 hypothetical protein [Spirochaetota bacterium]HOM86995.1 hypothetical protein [Spirochaetota bacterium]HOR93575.1 hypothetical protein [Spirochaetota bacterium]HOT19224.1 hypothetical protein [Spirochaetota bacterium]